MAESVTIDDKEFVRLLSDPEGYTANDLQIIEHLLEKYPYCQPIHYAYSSALKNLKSDKFDSILQRSAAYSPVRESLFQYVEHPEGIKKALSENKEEMLPLSAYDLEKAVQAGIKPDEINENPVETEPLVMELIQNLALQSDSVEETDSIIQTEIEKTNLDSVEGVEDVGILEREAAAKENLDGEDQVFEEISEDFQTETDLAEPAIKETVEDIDDETFDEVADIDYGGGGLEETNALDVPDEDIAEAFENEEIDKVEEAIEDGVSPSKENVESAFVSEVSLSDQIETITPDSSEFGLTEKVDNEELSEVQHEVSSLTGNAEPVSVDAIINDSKASLADQIETVIPDFEWPDFKLFGDIKEIEEPEGEQKVALMPEITESETSTENVEASQEKLVIDSIAATDYFVFDKSSVDPLKVEELEIAAEKPVQLRPVPAQADELSKYHDKTLPFTFVWWLHKTRKAHDVNYQPYLAQNMPFAQAAPAPTDLNQQIIESIFHYQPELNTFPEILNESPPLEVRKNEDRLIERFIKEDPQIKPPLANKLDTENKARKSSEDNLDLVSETLAKIYIDQMLYHKAIDTYKKLSLKFPEKSAYFAAQISDLEKIIN